MLRSHLTHSESAILLYEHLNYVHAGDLLLVDRGYPSVSRFFILTARQIEFCVRTKEDWNTVRDFKASGEKDRIVELILPKRDWYYLEDYSDMQHRKLRCRLVSVELKNGETEILCTSLTDSSIYLYEDFKELYPYRLNIEYSYKLFKSRLEIENFSGKNCPCRSAGFPHEGIYDEPVCAVLAFPIEERVNTEYLENKTKHPRKINGTFALGSFKDIVVGLF